MDLNDIWQEHKVWILGVLAGIVAFFVGSTLISNQYDTSKFRSTIRASQSTLRKKRFFGSAQRSLATKDEAAADRMLGGVEGRTYFVLRKDYDLTGKGDPTLHYLARTTQVKKEVQDAMDASNVEFTQQQLGLPANSPVDRSEIQKTLVALDLVEDALTRLLEAAATTVDDNPNAIGLRTVDKIQIDTKATSKRRRGRYARSRRTKKVDLGPRVSVGLRFHADAITLQAFLESLLDHDGKRALLLESFTATTSDRPGEPMEVKCKLLAIMKQEA